MEIDDTSPQSPSSNLDPSTLTDLPQHILPPPSKKTLPPPHTFATIAPRLRISRQVYNSVEYPGYISGSSGEGMGLASSSSTSSSNTSFNRQLDKQISSQPPTESPSYLQALYTLGVRPSHLPSLALGTSIPQSQSTAEGGMGEIEHIPTPIDGVFNSNSNLLELNWRPKWGGARARVTDNVNGGVEDGGEQSLITPNNNDAQSTPNIWSRPIQGERMPVGRVLVKLTMRRRRRRVGIASSPEDTIEGEGVGVGEAEGREENDGMDIDQPIRESGPTGKGKDQAVGGGGIFKVEMMGVVKHTVRFRAMADYQYTPFREDGQVAALVERLAVADAGAILNYKLPELDEVYFVPLNPLKSPSDIPEQSGSGSGSAPPAGPPIATTRNTRNTRATGLHLAESSTTAALEGREIGRGHDIPSAHDADDAINDENDPGEPLNPVTTPLSDARDGDISKWRSKMYASVPGMFSVQRVPHNFGFMPNVSSREIEVIHRHTGQPYKRLINMHRAKTGGQITVKNSEKDVPDGPSEEQIRAAELCGGSTLKEMKEKFEERPVWQKVAFLNQFSHTKQKEIHREKALVPGSCYTFADGTFKNAMCKFGYDPRKDPASYQYQRVFFRQEKPDDPMSGVRGLKKKLQQQQEQAIEDESAEQVDNAALDPRKSHIFDGKVLNREIANYQLIDVLDPFLRKFIDNPRARKATIDNESGWYKPKQWASMRSIIRLRWIALADPSDLEKAADAEESSPIMQGLISEFYDFDNALATSKTAAAGDGEDGEEEGEWQAEPQEAPVPRKRRTGRPTGGGGYKAVPTIPELDGTTVGERWKRKRTANMPMREDFQEALRVRALLEQQQKNQRQAIQRSTAASKRD